MSIGIIQSLKDKICISMLHSCVLLKLEFFCIYVRNWCTLSIYFRKKISWRIDSSVNMATNLTTVRSQWQSILGHYPLTSIHINSQGLKLWSNVSYIPSAMVANQVCCTMCILRLNVNLFSIICMLSITSRSIIVSHKYYVL